ncbi:MAG: hypothetical protein ACFFC1_10480 [Promethearchaeota archaeon]
MKKKRFLIFERDLGEKEPVYHVINKRFGENLGTIYYDSKWRKFVFDTYDSYYDALCLEQVVEFLKALDKRGYKNLWRQ